MVYTSDAVPIDGHPTWKWQTTTWPRQPYRYENVRVSDSRWRLPDPPPPAPGVFYYVGSIGDHLLRLRPSDVDSLAHFIHRFGLSELLQWTQERDFFTLNGADSTLWENIYTSYSAGRRSFDEATLSEAWTDQAIVNGFTVDQRVLRDAYDLALQEDINEATLTTIINLAWEQNAFRFDLSVDDDTGVIITRPSDIFARAWFELLDAVGDRAHAPRTCPYCHQPFLPRRSDQKYCAAECRLRSADQRRNEKRRRQEYKKMHRRKQRASDSQVEYDEWHDKWLEET